MSIQAKERLVDEVAQDIGEFLTVKQTTVCPYKKWQ